MEAVGVSLGTVALVSSVLDVFRIVASFRSYSESSTILFRQLDLEREILLQWATEVGLHESGNQPSPSPSIIPADLLPLVHKTVATIGGLLIRAIAAGEVNLNAELDAAEIRSILNRLEGEIEQQRRPDGLRRAESLRKLGWAIVEEERLKDVVNRIHTYNASLHNLIPKPVQIRIDGSVIRGVLVDKDQRELQELQSATLDLRKDISVVASVTSLHNPVPPVEPPATSQLMLQRSKLAMIGSNMARYLTSYVHQGEKIEVLVEWRAYNLVHNSDRKFQYISTCLDLVRLLHTAHPLTAYRTLDCLGIFDDVEFRPHPRVALVYKVPPVIDDCLIPIQVYTLHDLVNRGEFSRPRLDQRFELARALATGLHRIFISKWYHKNLNSKNVLFFIRNPGGKEITIDSHITRPYLTGFDYARPDSPEEVTIKPEMDEFRDRYRHPQCTHSESRERIPYQRQFDIYSLGILLMELARWETVDRVHKQYDAQRRRQNAVPPSSLSDFQEYLHKRGVESLGFRCGKIYMDVVRFCLSNSLSESSCSPDFEKPQVTDERSLVDAFNKQVVAELARCTV